MLLGKIFIKFRYILIFVKLKILHRDKIETSRIISIRGIFCLDIDAHFRIRIGKALSTQGPSYFKKSIWDDNLIIGNNVFVNHNCSITSVESIYIDDRANIANNEGFFSVDSMNLCVTSVMSY